MRKVQLRLERSGSRQSHLRVRASLSICGGEKNGYEACAPSRETPVSGVGRGFPTTGAAAMSSSPNPPRRSTTGAGGAGAFGAGAGAP